MGTVVLPTPPSLRLLGSVLSVCPSSPRMRLQRPQVGPEDSRAPLRKASSSKCTSRILHLGPGTLQLVDLPGEGGGG